MASRSWSSCLEVVPEPTREWNPEIAPQAMVINRAGNTVPREAEAPVLALTVMVSVQPVKAGMGRLVF